MKTIKKIVALTTLLWFTISLTAFSQDTQNKEGDGKMHIKIEVEKNGQVTKVDTTIDPQDLEALNEHLKDLDIHLASEDFPMMHDFKFDWDQDKWSEQMKDLEKQLQDAQINTEDFQKQMENLQEKMKNRCNVFQYKFKTDTDSATDIEMPELNKELENLDNLDMNFNFNQDGKTQTIVIDGDDIKIDGKKIDDSNADKEIIIKKSSPDGKGHKHKESKKVIILMKTSVGPEKQKAEFAAEPVKDENAGNRDANRVRVVEPKGNWLSELSCYPNPSSGEFTLSFRLNNPEAAELKIMDIAGREVFAENIPANTEWVEKQIKLPSNSSAAYLLILRQGNDWHHEKIFVKS
jgi:hypothetical protein